MVSVRLDGAAKLSRPQPPTDLSRMRGTDPGGTPMLALNLTGTKEIVVYVVVIVVVVIGAVWYFGRGRSRY